LNCEKSRMIWRACSPMDEKIVLKIPKAILVVYPAEVIELVRESPPLLMKALQRGKHEARAIKEQGRCGKNG